jgi:hypothetical protein
MPEKEARRMLEPGFRVSGGRWRGASRNRASTLTLTWAAVSISRGHYASSDAREIAGYAGSQEPVAVV